jgi:hypothetical protein
MHSSCGKNNTPLSTLPLAVQLRVCTTMLEFRWTITVVAPLSRARQRPSWTPQSSTMYALYRPKYFEKPPSQYPFEFLSKPPQLANVCPLLAPSVFKLNQSSSGQNPSQMNCQGWGRNLLSPCTSLFLHNHRLWQLVAQRCFFMFNTIHSSREAVNKPISILTI